tara:strand:+ start:309 stop:533 length:225 start_codon:yes stop_codon:yes gene_type:complete
MENIDNLLKEILLEKLEDLEQQKFKAKTLIEMYKDWQEGSPMQQRTRKKSLDKNLEKLPLLEKKINLLKEITKK